MTNEPSRYQQHYRASVDTPESFWAEQASKLPWRRFPETILHKTDEFHYRWFADGELNMSELCIDRHVAEGRGEQIALVYDSPVTHQKRKYSYQQLLDEVSKFAGLFKQYGLEKGDRVVIYMPMIPEAVFAMLACARLGAIHSVVFGGFAPHELAIRIEDATPKLLITASYGVEVDKRIAYKPLVDQALLESRYQPQHVLVWQRPDLHAALVPGRDVDMVEQIKTVTPAEPVIVSATHPLYILYTSGTTGKPKGIVRDTGGYAVALHYSMEAIYNTKAGEVFWAASDVGWVVGHSYIVYGPLLQGCTTILYEGKPVKTPDAGAFWRVIEEYGVNVLFTAPTAIRAIRKEDPDGLLLSRYRLDSLRTLYLAGERCDPPTWQWAHDQLELPVVDHWWQTESGWPMVANPMGLTPLPVKPGSASVPVPGYRIKILHEDGHPLIPCQEGLVAIALPLPPGCLPTLWNDDARFVQSYLSAYPGYYLTGDGGYVDEENYVYIMGRVDDVINVAGHRLSTGEMEELVGAHPAVAECAVIGIADELRGQLPVGLVVLKDGHEAAATVVEAELVQLIREKIGAVAVFKTVLVVKRLPKTRSGKILRKTMRMIADGVHYAVPSTIDDPAVLTEIHDVFRDRHTGQAFLPQHIA